MIIIPFELINELKEEKKDYELELDNIICRADDCSECFLKHCPVEYLMDQINRIENAINKIQLDYNIE